jgi:hypothetical protein
MRIAQIAPLAESVPFSGEFVAKGDPPNRACRAGTALMDSGPRSTL